MKNKKQTHDPITGKKLQSIFVRCTEEEKARWVKASQVERRSLSNMIRYSIMRMCASIEDRVKDPQE